MAAGAARRQLWLAVAAACVLHSAAGVPLSLTADDQDTCRSALGMLRGCSPQMQEHDLQQHCCVPFYALEGLDCFCDGALADLTRVALLPSTIDGLAACGVDSPFSRITHRQDVCVRQEAGVAAVRDEFVFPTQLQQPSSGLLSEGAIQLGPDGGLVLPSSDLEDRFYFDPALAEAAESQAAVDELSAEQAWDLFIEGGDITINTPEQGGVSIDVAMDGGRDVFSISGGAAELALYDGVLSITETDSATTDVTVSSGDAQVTVSVPSDTEVEVLLDLPYAEEEEEKPLLVADADGSSAAVYSADFADVRGMMGLIGQWLGGLLQRAGPIGGSNDAESQEVVGGLSRLLAEILAKLESSFAGTPLDVEISYELDDEALKSGETEIDIEIDPQLAPALTPQFLDERLQALSNALSRPVRPSPVRLSDGDLLEAGYLITPPGTPSSPAPSLSNCFNRGVCAWLCRHQRALQIALGIETALLLALLVLYRWLNCQMEREELESDEESLRVPLIVHAADYADEEQGKAAALWTLTTKVGFEKA